MHPAKTLRIHRTYCQPPTEVLRPLCPFGRRASRCASYKPKIKALSQSAVRMPAYRRAREARQAPARIRQSPRRIRCSSASRCAGRDRHRVQHYVATARAGVLRSCLIFESKRRPRRRYTAFDVLPPDHSSRDGVTTDMYNHMPRRRARRNVAYVRALLTTASPLLTARSRPGRVHDASRPDRQGVLDEERPMEGPGAPGAPAYPG